MYPPLVARRAPDATAYVMAAGGERLTYRELDLESNRLAHLLRSRGVAAGGTLLLVMENRLEWPVVVAAGMRTGLYVAPVNWHLGPEELAAVIRESSPRAVVTSARFAGIVREALAGATGLVLLAVDPGLDGFEDLSTLLAGQPDSPVTDERLGARVLFSGGSTGRPRAHRQPLLDVHPEAAPPRHAVLADRLDIGPATRLLSPAPSYHAAPFTFQLMVLAAGGSVVCMEGWDAGGALAAIAEHEVTHSQWVPTMLSRLLALDDRESYALGPSHRVAFTSGAPCPVEVKRGVMDWWGPILHEYYGASEGYGHTYISPREALTHPGSVGRALSGEVAVCGDDGSPLPTGEVGQVRFDRGGMGDLGRLDEDGFLYLVGRASSMVISGGVNIYPEESEEALLSHPDVADVAVIGVPDPDLGEQVLAVVELLPGATRDPAKAAELIAHCRSRLAHYKAPRVVEFVDVLPRLPTGKLNKPALREDYLEEKTCP